MSEEKKIDDGGGPAFPTDRSPSQEYTDIAGGLTKREWFATHAPIYISPWFKPVLAPRPKTVVSQNQMFIENEDEIRAWERDSEKQMEIQWPWAWADAVIAQGKKP